MNYLEDRQEYIDRYDLDTIEDCIKWYQNLKSSFLKHRKEKEFKKYTDEEFNEEVDKVLNRFMLVIKTQWFKEKEKTITKWMNEDKKLQDEQDNTPTPKGINCLVCGKEMELISKDLQNVYEKEPYMLFMFECKKCNKRRAVNEDGSEWIYKKPKCPKCKSILKNEVKHDGDILTFIDTCPKCDYKKVDVSDHKKWKEEQEIKEKRNKELLEKFREECCYSEEKGKEMVELSEILSFAHEVREFEASKYDDPTFEKSVNINKVGIVEVENILKEILEKEKYIKFSTDKPEIDRYVFLPFSFQDSDSLRSRKNNLSDLEKLIKNKLEGTNWRLLSGSLMNRLGFITGKLKGYEHEEDFQEICGYKKENNKKKLDPEKLAKYGNNNMVQLEKMLGEYDGIERMRKRRLIKEPDGFLLEPSDTTYTCTICHEQSPTGETCWFSDALWCKECKRNIDEGVVPKLLYFDDDHDKDWFTESDLKYSFGLKTPTIRKLEKEGILHPRELKNLQGWIYCSVFLLKENKEFFKTHKKVKKIFIESTIRGSNGEEIKL